MSSANTQTTTSRDGISANSLNQRSVFAFSRRRGGGQNLFSKGLGGQLKKNGLKRPEEQQAVDAFYNKIKEQQESLKKATLLETVKTIMALPEFKAMAAQAKKAVEQAHQRAKKSEERANKALLRGKIEEKEMNRAMLKRYGQKAVRDARRKAIGFYTEALLNATRDEKGSAIYVKALAGRTRCLPASSQLGSAYMLLACNNRANTAMEVATALKRLGDTFLKRSKRAERSTAKAPAAGTPAAGGGSPGGSAGGGAAAPAGSKLKSQATIYYQKAIRELCRAAAMSMNDSSLKGGEVTTKEGKKVMRADRRGVTITWAARLLNQIKRAEPGIVESFNASALEQQEKAQKAKKKQPEYTSTDVYKNVDVDSKAGLVALKAFNKETSGSGSQGGAAGVGGGGGGGGKKSSKQEYIFSEQPVAFRHKGYLCPGCWRNVRSSLYPCPSCNEVYYCREICQLSDRHLRMCTLTKFIRSSMGQLPYLVAQLVTRATTHEMIQLGRGDFTRPVLAQIQNAANIGKLQSTFNLYNSMLAEEVHKLVGDQSVNILMMSMVMQLSLYLTEHLTTTPLPEAKVKPDEYSAANLPEFIVAVYKVFRVLFQCPAARSALFGPGNRFVGTGFGSFGARLTRSCNANVFRRLTGGGRIVYRACQEIKPGDLLTISCGKRGARPYGLPKEVPCCAQAKL